jgi:hypothetical protein
MRIASHVNPVLGQRAVAETRISPDPAPGRHVDRDSPDIVRDRLDLSGVNARADREAEALGLVTDGCRASNRALGPTRGAELLRAMGRINDVGEDDRCQGPFGPIVQLPPIRPHRPIRP